MLIIISQIIIDSVKDEKLKSDVIIKLVEPESLYVRISNKYYYFYMGYIPYEMKLPEGLYYIEYEDKKDSFFLKGGYVWIFKFPSYQKEKIKKKSYEYQIKKEFNKDINRDSCYIVLEGEVDEVIFQIDSQSISYKVPSEFMYPAKKQIKILAKDLEKELFLEPQFIYYITIKAK
jgi:hypothetical protein